MYTSVCNKLLLIGRRRRRRRGGGGRGGRGGGEHFTQNVRLHLVRSVLMLLLFLHSLHFHFLRFTR